MLLIPSIDLRGGRCVRLREGNFAHETAYSVEPEALLERYDALGARWLHIVDLDGARNGAAVNLPVIENLARRTSMRLQVGGGIRRASSIEALFSAGVARAVVGSVAVQEPQEVVAWLDRFGLERLCVALDVRILPGDEPQVHTRGWTCNSTLTLSDAIAAFPAGTLKHVLCTDIGRDGTLRGPNLSLYRAAVDSFPGLCWQASGGIRCAADLTSLSLLGVTAAVSGTALLEELIPTEELRPFLPAALSPA
jgi:phosphoribosylformimino-5-aminoimidazole carboxamide ribotide isomerase